MTNIDELKALDSGHASTPENPRNLPKGVQRHDRGRCVPHPARRTSDIGLATVYRVLTQFEQAGILLRSNFESGKAVTN